MPDPVPDLLPGAVLFTWAALCEKFSVLPHQLAPLTDVQIERLLLHKRDSSGVLVPPEPPEPPAEPVTDAARLRTIDQLEAERLITPQRAAELRDEVAKRAADQTD